MGFSFFAWRSGIMVVCFAWLIFVSVGRSAEDVAAESSFSFSFRRFEEPQGAESAFSLYGDAKVVNASVRITSADGLGRGRIMYRKPLRFGRKPSFSSHFSFAISPGLGDGLAFLLAPSNVRPESLDGHLFGLSPGIFAVEFDTSMDPGHNDPDGNHVGVDLGSPMSVLIGNISKLGLNLSSGERLQTWIDYNGVTRMLEVRLGRAELLRPQEPIISYPIDLSGLIWKNSMSVGIASSNRNSSDSGNSTQISTVYSWDFRLRHAAAYVMHSEPMDPQPILNPPKQQVIHHDYLPGLLVGLVFGAACGALTVILVLFAWAAFVDRRPMTQVECPVHPVEYGYEKVVVAGHVTSSDAAKL